MPAKPSTRDHIMQTAEKLFASKGVDAVSLNEINKAAGQKNTSSLHYHFGSKEGLIQAIVYSHYEEIESKMQASLDAMEQRGDTNLEWLVIASTQPFIDKLETPSGINYLLIVAQLLNKSADMLLEGHPDNLDKARVRMLKMYEQQASEIPAKVKIARLVLFSSLLFHSLASFARFEQSGNPNPLGDKAFYVDNLRKVLLAMIQAPVD